MVQGGGGFGFLYETTDTVAVSAGVFFDNGGGKDFQRDFAIETRVIGKVNLTHPTSAELGADFVAANPCVRGEGQRRTSGG
jgi:hypothetical protein